MLQKSQSAAVVEPDGPPILAQDGGALRALAALQAAGAFADGNIGLISIEAIRDRFGDRWERKAEQIWEHVNQFLRRQFRPDDLILQLDEVQVLIAQPGRPALLAQMQCIRAAVDLIRFFLGEVETPHVQVKTVQSFKDGEIVCAPVDPRVVRSLMDGHDAAEWRPKARGRTPILTPLGRELSAELWLEPILALQPGPTAVGHLVRTVLSDAVTGEQLDRDARDQLQPRDIATADLKVLSEALRLRATLPNTTGAIVVPVSYLTLAHSTARYELMEVVRKLSPAERHSFAFEIVDMEPGVPSGRLAELVAIARRQCRGVICRMDLSINSAEKLKQVEATLSVMIERPESLTEYALLKLEGIVAETLKRIPAMLLHQTPAASLTAACLAGFTHCTVHQPG